MIYLENIQKFQEEPLEYQFRDEIAKRLFDYAYKKQVQYNKDLQINSIEANISESAKLRLNEEHIIQYLKNKLFKISDDYIDALYDLKEYKKAICILDRLSGLKFASSDVKEILSTAKNCLNLLNSMEDLKQTKKMYILSIYAKYLIYCLS